MPNRAHRPKTPGFIVFRTLPWLVLLAGFGATYLAWQSDRNGATRLLRREFEFRVSEIVGDIKYRFDSYEQVLRGASGLFNVTQSVSRADFRTYVETLRLQESYPGIQSIGFTLLIPAKDKPRHEEQVRREGFPHYVIRPPGKRDPFTSLIYVEPFSEPNLRSFGLDAFAEPVRRAAMERARDENATAISGKVMFAPETPTAERPGFIMYRPVYRVGAPRETLDQRRANLVGWVGTAFRANDLMQGILRENFDEFSAAFDIEIFDGDSTTPAALLYDSSAAGSKLGNERGSLFRSLRHIDVAGRPWTLAVYSLPAFESRMNTGTSTLIAITGSLGTLLLALLIFQLVRGRAYALLAAQAMDRELNERKHTEEALRASEERWSFAVEGTGAGVWDWNLATGNIQYSQHWKEMYQLGEGSVGSTLDEWDRRIHPEDRRRVLATRKELADGKLGSYACEYRMRGPDDSWKWILDRGLVVGRDVNGKAPRIIGTHTDITEKKRDEELVWHQANYDALTGLPNRRLFRDRLQQTLRKARRTGQMVALLFIDLDCFKEVNDSLGHTFGDLLLKQAAQRISACVREADTTARLGGDEFIVMVADLTDNKLVERVAQDVVQALSKRFVIDGKTTTVTASVGIAFYPNNATDRELLIKYADEAMYAAKVAGGNRYRYFVGPRESVA